MSYFVSACWFGRLVGIGPEAIYYRYMPMTNPHQHFVAADSPQPLEDQLVSSMREGLRVRKRIVWLTSGGSAIAITVAVASRLSSVPELQNLTIGQVDERYGAVGHADSNWRMLLDAGFRCPGARYRPILHNVSFEKTVASYEQTLSTLLQQSDLCIGLFGIGADGHTAGMLPNSTAASESKHLVVGYTGPDYSRITMTTPAIARLDVATAYVSGPAKIPALQDLQADLPIEKQPGQALKQAKELYIYSDNFPLPSR
jgi:6-phosphogluconolactonase/glucosamine-6-phosphate isomerase/deaminase